MSDFLNHRCLINFLKKHPEKIMLVSLAAYSILDASNCLYRNINSYKSGRLLGSDVTVSSAHLAGRAYVYAGLLLCAVLPRTAKPAIVIFCSGVALQLISIACTKYIASNSSADRKV